MIRPLVPVFFAASVVAAAPLATTGCAQDPQPPRTALSVSPRLSEQGESIYFGRVFPLAGTATQPTFVYERRVASDGSNLVSTHVTRSSTGEVALAEEASHSAEYGLTHYQLHTNQLGQRGRIDVVNGDVHFRLIDGAREVSAVEHRDGTPVVVGPTLVGYIYKHLSALRAGKRFRVRLAVLERLETLGFDLETVRAPRGQTQVRMSASSFVVALAVDPVLFTFETETGKLVRLEGRVPSKRPTAEGLEDFDARVEYRFVADR